MADRYAVYDTLTDRDLREFDDLPHAYALIDQLKKRHGSRYSVRTTREHRDRIVRIAQASDDFLCGEHSNLSPSADAVDAKIGQRVPEALKQLATAVERIGEQVIEIKRVLPNPEVKPTREVVPLQRAGGFNKPLGALEPSMWEKLTPNDLLVARQQIGQRREELLRKHAEELASIQAEQTELETLQRLIGVFAEKFMSAATETPHRAAGTA